MSESVDCVVIGAGVVGLAVGRALAQAGREVIVVERHGGIGEETSSRNSEVIHAGLYYPTGSLKARLCITGREQLYAFCAQKEIPHRRCGKLIVATEADQLGRLAAIARQAAENGVRDLSLLDADAVAARAPALSARAALWSPSTGIVDSHALMLALAADLEAADGFVVFDSTVLAIDVASHSLQLRLRSGDDESEFAARTVINAGGLAAGELASACRGAGDYAAPRIHFARGSYFLYEGESPFDTLIYPLPVDGGLGIHATIDLAGRLRFGPDVEWIARPEYGVDPGKRDAFAAAIRHYWPEFDEARLAPGYAGVRPKLSGPGEPVADFRIDVAASDAKRQLIHLLGIESPGLTACLALGDAVAALAAQRGA